MIACCAHHLADLLPIIGAASAAGLLTDYRLPFMVAGIALNTLTIVVVPARIRHHRTLHPTGAV